MSGNAVPDLIYRVIQDQRALHPDRPVLIGVAGAQGSGKTTACQLLEAANRPRFAHFSLDDVYLTKAEREWHAAWRRTHWIKPPSTETEMLIHPLRDRPEAEVIRLANQAAECLLTRGPPGSHDLGLTKGLIARLSGPLTTHIPRFDKANDDRAPENTWREFTGPAEAILIDGWCLGALPPSDTPPLNALERADSAHLWLSTVSGKLSSYRALFDAFDAIIYLRAPNWEIVRAWRGQQEEQTLGRKMTADEEAKLDRFLMFYERITRSMIDGGFVADWVVQLDAQRGVVSIANPPRPVT